MDRRGYGLVLAAQAAYGVLQILVDNGPAFFGARIAAQGTVTGGDRALVAAARIRLGAFAASIVAALALIQGGRALAAGLPYALALLLFALMNVWESYGAGDLLPYAAYLLLRSLGLVVVAAPFALASLRLPLVAAGLAECAVIGVVMAYARRPVLSDAWGGARIPTRSIPWSRIVAIGGPALLAQYCLSIGTVALGAAGRASAAAALAVGVRLLTGLQGLNGAVAAAVFPRLARSGKEGDPSHDERANARTLAVIVLSSGLALAVLALAPHEVSRLLLPGASRRDELVMLLALSGATASGVTLQVSFALVARHMERRIIRASLSGAALISLGALAAATVGHSGAAALTAAAAFVGGQTITALLLARTAVIGAVISRRTLLAPVAALLAAPAVAGITRIAPIAAGAGETAAVAWLAATMWRRSAESPAPVPVEHEHA